MNTRIPHSLKWLIDKRARIAGEIKKTKKALDKAKSLIDDLKDLEEKLAAQGELENRFSILDQKAQALTTAFKAKNIQGYEKLTKFPELSWAVLQHYEVCATPLLDVTHSLRVAASFALNSNNPVGYLYIFGFPHPNGSITYSVESELMNIRLLSICPPQAHRPYFQEGFLVGTFPARRMKKHPGLDVGVRLIAKFKLISKNFWSEDFHAIPDKALYPEHDDIKNICHDLLSI